MGDERMAKGIWVDEAGQPWRRNRYTNRYEKLDGGQWVPGTPVGDLRREEGAPLPSPWEGGDFVVAEPDVWLVKGDRGFPGDQGPAGPEGPTGPQGNIGPTGPQGSQGPQGNTGQTGLTGPQGNVGPQGNQGNNGIQGDVGPQGLQGDVGPQGPVGPKGDLGNTGSQGPKGDTGTTGPQGNPGVQGVKGNTGDTGPQGIQGVIGPVGPKGDLGNTGAQGPVGPQGDVGPTGSVGPAGSQGLQGLQGIQGPSGATGAKGDTGNTGLTGSKGDTGLQGPQGIKGDKGDTGSQGPQGPSGGTPAWDDIQGRPSTFPPSAHNHTIGDVSGLQTALDAKQSALGYTAENAANKGQAGGYASLDSGGKVPVSQLPNSIMEYQGTWNAATNTPALANGTGNTGDVYRVTAAGTRNLGSGNITFDVGDYAVYNGTAWEKSDTTDAVGSVAGLTGNIGAAELTDALLDGVINHVFTAADDTKLMGIATGATANSTDAQLRDRATHTGTQAQSTIVNLVTDLAAKAPLNSPAFTGTPTGITKIHVGLDNVDNTADSVKPVSTPQQAALDGKQPKFLTGTVATAVGTAAKTVTLDAPWASYTPVTGDVVCLTYTNGTNVGTVTVAMNGGAARNVRLGGNNVGVYHHAIVAGGSALYRFDGTYLNLFGSHYTATDPNATATSNSPALRDGNANLLARNFIPGVNPVTAAAGNTALSIATNPFVVVSGTTTQTVTLPTTSVLAGHPVWVTNLSTGAVTVNSSAGTLAATLPTGSSVLFMALQNTPTTPAHWLTEWIAGLTKSMVGLGNVDNTADSAKPVSTAQQAALDLKANIASPTFTGTVTGISKTMVGLGNVDNTTDANKPISTVQQNALDLKAPLASPAFTGTPTGITKAHVGLGNVDNTADTAKPVSTAQQTALDGKSNIGHTHVVTDVTGLQAALDAKAPLASPTFTGTVSGITKSMVGLANVDNTADTAKPVSTAQQNALNLKANIASPTFTGTVAGISKSMVGLGNVDNTSDVNKPVSTAQQSSLDTKLPVTNVASGQIVRAALLNTHYENIGPVVLPHMFNDNHYLLQRGGSVLFKINGVTQPGYDWSPVFTPDLAYTSFPVAATSDVAVIEVTLARKVQYSFTIGIAMTDWCRAQNVLIETYDATAGWITLHSVVGDGSGYVWIPSGNSYEVTKVRYTLTNFAGTNPCRITSLFQVAFNSELLTSGFLPKGGGTMYGDVVATNVHVDYPSQPSHATRRQYVEDVSAYLQSITEPKITAGTTSQFWRGDKTFATLDKTAVGLGNVDNVSDANKPVSTAQQTALNLKANLASPTFTGTVSGITATMVGLGNVTNTSDANKPVSTAQQTALNLKANLASPTFTGTVGGITKAMVGLTNVDNTSDVSKPISTATQAILDLKAQDATVVHNIYNETIAGTKTFSSRIVASAGVLVRDVPVTNPTATPSINVDVTDQATFLGMTNAITSMTTNLTGTPVNGQKLMVRFTSASALAIAWGASFVSSGAATLLATTVAGKTHHVGLIYDSALAKWVCIASDATGY